MIISPAPQKTCVSFPKGRKASNDFGFTTGQSQHVHFVDGVHTFDQLPWTVSVWKADIGHLYGHMAQILLTPVQNIKELEKMCWTQ
jgi:hypothetical protein